jgi:O-antigen/teichoic acid export membrane protein
MNLGRIVQLLFSNLLAQLVSIFMQLVVPPLFLRFYANGIEVYGEWIALSASISYLHTLNLGVQTYASNQMTILYSAGDIPAAKTVQASALRLLLLLIILFVFGGLSVLLIPVDSLLKLTHVAPFAARLTLYLLMVQMAVFMLFDFLINSYMAIRMLHRGGNWVNAQRFCSVLLMGVALWHRSSFAVLAAVQLGSLLLFLLLVFLDVRRTAPILLPSLRYGNWRQVADILKPSGHFGLIAIAGILTWQGPVLLIQIVLGPAAAGLFSLVRVVFQMSRQLLAITSWIIGQDISLLVGKQNWEQLRRLYDLSERVVLFLVPVISVGSLLMCPFLFAVWLHKRDFYDPLLCILMAMISAALGIKEHKTQFQSASNQHEALSYFVLSGYAIMLFVSFFSMRAFGLAGFLVTWLVWEIIQTGFVLRLNARLFPSGFGISARPVLRLSAFMAGAFALAAVPAWFDGGWSLGRVTAVAVGITALLAVAAYFAFGLEKVRTLVFSRMKGRFAPGT